MSGSPEAFGAALAWEWTREMPPTLKGSFLTLLYASWALSSDGGQLRLTGDGKPIRIQDIAKAAGCREKDARRYLEAAALAGVVVVVGEQRKGRATLYELAVCPAPDWTAAAVHVKATGRSRKPAEAAADAASSGRGGPNTCEMEVQATARARPAATRPGTGHYGPNQPEQYAVGGLTVRPCGWGKQRTVRPDRDKCGSCLLAQPAEHQPALLAQVHRLDPAPA